MLDSKIILSILLLVALFLVSIPFEAEYAKEFQILAHNPAARFIAGCILVWLSSIDASLGGLAFLVLFLWIADIQLLSSIKLK
jgi:hypothetical protein